MNMKSVTERLAELADAEYREFQIKLVPNIPKERILGVRIPKIRAFCKEIAGSEEAEEFINSLPHGSYDENNLHALLISAIKDYDRCIAALEVFLPYVDNWATCDIMSPKIFKRHKAELMKKIKEWVASGKTYTIRFGIEMLMSFYLDGDFKDEYNDLIAGIRSEEYYVNMIKAWYFATALAKQYDATLPYIENKKLDVWSHNKSIQKAVESYRITAEQKEYLRTLKIK